ncbi:HEPN domain-containing protein [Levilactobacillus brevis]|uniref:HEPN domain-containing protein n=1 Tax=Levilactobacillus brevis TaxID=1580 RepID=UPI001F34B9BD|nr:hypothetical protein [Levilactobacillus brevis]MCE6014028.1 hypothetical protein [Levilactobacillus brevis]MCE6016403.1 hypothetical protein [Levilactobacillus brevis]MCE6018807.1 hypothetical protein [Levilactobacillus brevis]MCE6021268.1 hypothetical protein [Levilactobacillus brevis]MCE6023724.1 hypothetical protein [Levilactobacillus brevis]
MNSKISQLSSFVITAVWGDSEATMTQNGTLEYDKTGLSLSMSVSNSYSENTMNKSTRLFGTGILNSSSRNDEKFMTSVKVSLSGLAVIESQTTYSNKEKIFYLKYTVISAFIGDFFVTNKTSFDSLRFFPTNFSNWLQGNVNSPKYLLDDPFANQIDIKISSLKDNDNQLAFYSKNLKFKIVRDVETHNAQEHVDHLTSDILVRNSIDFFEAKASVQGLLLRNAQVSNWFNLLSKNDEFNYRIIGQTKDRDILQEVQLFSFDVPSPKINRYSFISTWQRRDTNWGKTIIKSLNAWICRYDSLMPIFNAISSRQSGDLDQCLQAECVVLENIFDISIGEKEYRKMYGSHRNRKIYYREKVTYVMTHSFEQRLVNKIISSSNWDDENLKKIDGWISVIKNIRNSLSHNTDKHITPFIKSVCHDMLRVLIRDWLLATIGIDRSIINSEYIGKTFKYSLITAWHN